LEGAVEEEEDLEEENEELEEENEELQEEVEELEEEEDEEEEEVEEVEEDASYYDPYYDDGYYFEDDYYYDSYWDDQDWDSIWGEYACEDLFDQDMEGGEFNPDEAPGADDWPYINIYGNCMTCEAYIVDYYSTEHFQNIINYNKQGTNFLIAALVGMVITNTLGYVQLLSPIAEKELELLPNDGGAMA